jgi:hypothetical protein
MSGAIKMDKFELNHAVTLFTQQTTTINSLWTVYVAATFAAAGYGFTASPLQPKIALAVTIGFLAFAFGNWKLLKQGLTINQQLQKDISEFLASQEDVVHKIGLADIILALVNLAENRPREITSGNTDNSSEQHAFRPSIKKLIATANPPWISLVIHLLIDVCVVVALWSRVHWSTSLLSD